MPELSQKQWDELKRYYAKGFSLHELERIYPVSRVAIKEHLRRRGLLKSPKKAKCTAPRPIVDPTVDDSDPIIEMEPE